MKKNLQALLFFLFSLVAVRSYSQIWNYYGNTIQQSCQCYQLTDNVGSQAGSMWNLNQLNLTNPFDFTFDVFLGTHDDGADGIVFVLQNTNNTAPPSLGGGMGYSGFPNQSIGIELDTYDNGGGAADIAADHLALDINGNISAPVVGPVQMSGSSADVEDGAWHTIRFVWNPATETLSVYFDGVFRLQYTFPGGLANSIFAGNPNVYWGWTGATGGAFNTQSVCVHFTSDFLGGTNYTACGVDTVHFQSTATSGLSNIVDYAWDFGDGTPVVHAQNPIHTFPIVGTFNVLLTITDQSLCTATQTHQVVIYPVPVITPTHTNVACNGATTGNATATVSTGTQPYTALWSSVPSAVNPNGPTVFTNTGLSAGNYTVTITDLNSCSTSATYNITQPATALSATVTSTNVTCFGANDGTAAITIGGGTPPYTYLGVAIPAGVTNLTVLAPNNYGGTVLDANGCSQVIAFTITQPTDIVINQTHTNIACFGDATGDITLNVSGGVGPNYSYNWNPNVSLSNVATSLAANTYNVTVIDQTNCQKTISVTLTQPSQPLTINVSSTNVSCFGFNNGTITIGTSGGTPNYTYTWNPNVSTTNSATGLTPNSYSITVADANGCSVVPNVVISQPNQPLTLDTVATDLTCFQSNDGTVATNATGGTFPYIYNWNPNITSTGSASSLPIGTYQVTVTDNNGCSGTASFGLTQPPLLTSSETHVDVLCNGNSTGSIDITVNGGTPIYSYAWSPNVSATNTVTSIPAGLYSATVTDAHGCSLIQTANVTEPPAIVLTTTETDVLCNGDNTGTITATGSGGVLPYNFSATPDGVNILNAASGQFQNLFAGNYSVSVTDQHACVTTGTIMVNEPPVLTDIATPTPTTCYHYSHGRVSVTVAGGVPQYSFEFSTGLMADTGLLTGLIAGTYSVTVTDANGCTITDSATVTQPDSVLIDITPNPTEVKLGDELQLSSTTNQSGNVYFDWSPKFGLTCYDCTAPLFSGVYSQNYLVVATNDAGCIGTFNFTAKVIPIYDVFLPNAFTPNGDGVNDFWQMFGRLRGIKQVEVAVFNRIGEKVFQSNELDFKWDGNYKGVHSPPGVYTYYAKFVWMNNHSDSDYKGTITMLQ